LQIERSAAKRKKKTVRETESNEEKKKEAGRYKGGKWKGGKWGVRTTEGKERLIKKGGERERESEKS